MVFVWFPSQLCIVRCKEQHLPISSRSASGARDEDVRWGHCLHVFIPNPSISGSGAAQFLFSIISSHILPSGVSPSITRGSGHRSHITERSRSYSARLCSVWVIVWRSVLPEGESHNLLYSTHTLLYHTVALYNQERGQALGHTQTFIQTPKNTTVDHLFFAMLHMKSEKRILLEELKFPTSQHSVNLDVMDK